jgi:hypothetical protein
MREAVLVWFVLAVLIEIASSVLLLLWLRRRGVLPVFGLTGVPGYLERVYLEWCRTQGRSWKRVVVLRTLSILNVVLSAVVAIPMLIGSASRPHSWAEECFSDRAPLQCLQRSFGKPYADQYDAFWAILREGARRAERCSPVSDAAEFLALGRLPSSNAEFNEFLAKHVERMCVRAPQCFRESFKLLDQRASESIRRMLRSPVFEERVAIDAASCLPDGSVGPAE